MKSTLDKIESITELIPQRAPIICIDKLIAVDKHSATTTFDIPQNFLFAHAGHITAPGLLENVAQTAAAKAGYFRRLDQRKVGKGYIASFKHIDFISYPKTGSKLISTIDFIQAAMTMSVFRVQIKSEDKLVLTGEMNIITEDEKLI